jgi:hypothetical protein
MKKNDLMHQIIFVIIVCLFIYPINSTMSTPEKPRIIALFDVDGTLTIPRGEITDSMMKFMTELSKKITVGIVGGSDLPKQQEQLGNDIVKLFPYNFSQNGLVAYKNGELLEVQTISKHLGEDNLKRVVNWVMKYLSDVDIPVKVSFVYIQNLAFLMSTCLMCLHFDTT